MFPFHYHEGDGQYGRPQVKSAGWETFQETGPAGKFSINHPRTHTPAELQPLPPVVFPLSLSRQLDPSLCGADGTAGACEDPPPRLPDGR